MTVLLHIHGQNVKNSQTQKWDSGKGKRVGKQKPARGRLFAIEFRFKLPDKAFLIASTGSPAGFGIFSRYRIDRVHVLNAVSF